MQPPSSIDGAASRTAGSTGGRQQAPATGYTLQEAAALLGVSINTLRRRLEAGEIAGQKVHRPQGYAWRVLLNVERPPSTQQVGQEAPQEAGSRLQDPPTSLQPVAAVATLVAPLLEQAIRPLVEQIGAMSTQLTTQAEELGRLRAELAGAQDTIRALRAPPTVEAQQPVQAEEVAQDAIPTPPPAESCAGASGEAAAAKASAPEKPRHPWWQFWRGLSDHGL